MDEELKKYLSLFVTEAAGHVEQLARGVAHLSDDAALAARPELTDELFRHAHSVKGMAAAMRFDEIFGLAQAAEELLGQVQQRHLALSAELGRKLSEATERLLAMIQARGRGALESPALTLIAALRSWAG